VKVQEVILRAMAKRITWWEAAEILGISDRSLRRWREFYEEHGYDGLFDLRRGQPSPAGTWHAAALGRQPAQAGFRMNAGTTRSRSWMTPRVRSINCPLRIVAPWYDGQRGMIPTMLWRNVRGPNERRKSSAR
jgi:hypothetical protein